MESLPELLTFKEAFDPQISHAESKDWQFVQSRSHILGKGQEVHQPIQLPIQPIPVAFWWVRLNNFIAFRDLSPGRKYKENTCWGKMRWGHLFREIRNKKKIQESRTAAQLSSSKLCTFFNSFWRMLFVQTLNWLTNEKFQVSCYVILWNCCWGQEVVNLDWATLHRKCAALVQQGPKTRIAISCKKQNLCRISTSRDGRRRNKQAAPSALTAGIWKNFGFSEAKGEKVMWTRTTWYITCVHVSTQSR